MNRLTVRSAFALLLLLTVLMLTLTCATATAANIRYIYYDQDGNWELLEAPIIEELGYCFYYGDDGDVTLKKINPDGANFYLDRESTLFDVTRINIDKGDVCLVLSYEKDAYPPFYVWDDASLSFYNEEHFSGTRNATSICLSAGSTLNLNSANLNLSGSIRYFPSSSEPAAKTATVNIYGGTNRITVSADGESGIGQGIELNIFGGELFITGGSGQPALNCTSLNFSPSSGSYILVYDGVDEDTRTLIGAYNQSNSDGALDTLRNYTALSMEKVRMTAFGIVETPQEYYVDESPRFQVNVLTEGVSPDSFTVEYKQNGAYSTTPLTQPGTYDVKITRPIDLTYLPFEKEITDGLVITKRSQTSPTGVAAVAETIRYRNDGRLTGVTSAMEYRAEAASGYTAVTGTEVAGLAPGAYFVRYKETATHFASGDVQLTVASGRAAYDTDSTQRAKTITADNVQPENEELLRQALSDYQSALDTLGGHFSEDEKQAVQAEMARISSALASLERTAAVRETIAALPDAVEPDDTDAQMRILAAKAAFDALTAHEKALVGDAPAAKLDSLLPMLTAYRITYGDGASIIVGQNTTLGFTAKGPLAKLSAVLVDGKTLDAAHYTAEAGSTIITLAADYVKTLPVGGHTLTVRYTDGETSAHFTVTAMPQDLPKTGDSSRLMGWVALLGACCAGVLCLRRRRG